MPSYKVIATGFHDGRLYGPSGKRRVLTVDKPFGKKGDKKNPMPSWVVPMPKESDAVKKKRKDQAESREAAETKQAVEDAKDIETASFMGDGESAEAGSKVETI